MYASIYDELIYEDNNSKKLLDFRKELIDKYSQDDKFNLQ